MAAKSRSYRWQSNHARSKFPTVGWWRYVFFDFWGFFGFMNRYLWRPIYIAYLVICLAAIVGKCKQVMQDHRLKAVLVFEPDSVIWRFFAFAVLINVIGVVYVSLAEISGPHGRYLFTCELPLLCFLLAGLDKLGKPLSTALVVLLVGLCAASTAWGWTAFYSMHSWTQ